MSTAECLQRFMALTDEQRCRAMLWLAMNYADVLLEAMEQASGDG